MSETLKSKIISAPAGSGKTERLAERYIELLKYAEPERILTITFTDKAAAEMKERIFKILKERDPVKYNLIKEKSLQLRIQTIDSFCFSLLRRFAHLIGYQPDLEVLTDNNYLKELSIFNTLFKIAEQEINTNDYQILINLITTNRFKGWDALRRVFDSLFQARLSPQRAKLPPIPGLERLPDLIAELEQDPITKERIPNFQFQIPQTSEEAEQLKAKITDIELIFLTKNKTPKKQGETLLQHQWNCKMAEYRKIIFNLTSNFRFEKTFLLFTNRFLKEFEELKKSLNQVDFADLEILTYRILTTHPEWSNILYLFDEHTDHILVDEFQDTSFLQWAIIAKLVEEWLSGEGAKRARGVKPTIFLVGDEKQSIYLFRNAHPEIFTRAKKQLSERLPKDEFEYIEIKENFRSLKAIIDFTNHIFPKLMNPLTDSPGWMTRYQEFQCQRNNPNHGIVEIILSPLKGNIAEARAKDAELVAKKILSIINKPIVYDQDEKPRPVRYEDITILLRTRTHLTAYENALREHQIPFIVVKGIGFYDTIEITLLRAILNFLVDPNDSFSAYLLLKSPLFNLSEKEILLISQTNEGPEANYLSLWQRFIAYSKNNNHHLSIINTLNKYLAMVGLKPMSQLIENMLDELDAWHVFWETPRYVNIKKFLRIVEQLEAEGLPPLLIANYFEKSSSKDEPKANVNTEGRNEVKIMTVHAAKGLQFPIVFVVGLDQQLTHRGSQEDILVINEQDEDTVYVLYEPDSELRKQSAIFQEKKKKEEEEEKRIFYVAVTRARDALFLTGIDQQPNKSDKPGSSQLKWLKDYLPIKFDEQQQLYATDTKIDGLSIISENQLSAEVQQLPTTTVSEEKPKKELLLQPLAEAPALIWRAVSKEIPEIYQEIRRKHGEEWITLGDILHQIFEKIANNKIQFELGEFVSEAIRLFNIYNIPKANYQKLLEEIERQFQIIKHSPVAEIIKPQPNSFAELPFVLKQGQIIYSGRIDRIIIKNNTINLYDYKTFPISKTEIAIYQEKYQTQLTIYKKAASKIFNMPKVLGYLIFTADGSIVPI
ncbi:MAG: UvrD-helicase domain-containing protein [candidate division WOR-3 bacterium]